MEDIKQVTYQQIVEEAHRLVGDKITKQQCDRLFSLFKKILVDSIIESDVVIIRGLGRFTKRKMHLDLIRSFWNRKTGELEERYVPSTTTVRFKPGVNLKKRLRKIK